MRIAVTGTNGIGKTTFIRDFMLSREGFTTPTHTYRDIIKNRYENSPTEKRQQVILDHMIGQMKGYGKNDNVIFDRCPIDNMVYTLWANNSGEISDQFVRECAVQLQAALHMIDLVLFIPITRMDNINLSESLSGDHGDLDARYAAEIDNIFKALFKEWDKPDSAFVDHKDKPHVIEVFGTREERVAMAELYVAEDGDCYSEESIITPQEIDQIESLNKMVTEQAADEQDSDNRFLINPTI